jgi:hypothetical protein
MILRTDSPEWEHNLNLQRGQGWCGSPPRIEKLVTTPYPLPAIQFQSSLLQAATFIKLLDSPYIAEITSFIGS